MSYYLYIGDHFHDPCKTIHRQKISIACKRKAIEDISQRPKKIILSEVYSSNTNVDINTQDISAIRKCIYRARRQTLPTNPTCISEVHDVIDFLKPITSKNENFLMINDINSNIIIFSCETNLSFLCKSETVYIDGTFSYCPNFFLQLFTLHGFINNHYVPLVFCLLPDKKQETYFKVLSVITTKCDEYNLILNLKIITIDFEIAIHNAVKLVWPSCAIKGCRFHLIQSWYRKIQELGLIVDYKQNNWLKHTFGLMYLNPEDVSDCFVFDLMSDMPDNHKYSQYTDYLLETYIHENSKFPPKIWACMTESLSQTTNNCGSFHSYFNQQFYKSHPNISIFLKILVENVQTDTYIKINSATLNIPNTPKNKSTLLKCARTSKAITDFKNKLISRYSYVKCVAFNYVKSINKIL